MNAENMSTNIANNVLKPAGFALKPAMSTISPLRRINIEIHFGAGKCHPIFTGFFLLSSIKLTTRRLAEIKKKPIKNLIK
jgi:hypothetical protein